MINKSKVIQIIAMARLGRRERLEALIAEVSASELACALARLPGQEQLDMLEIMDEPTRQATLLALDYADWIRLVDTTGPFNRHLVDHGHIQASDAHD